MITEKSLPSMVQLLEELVVTESPSQEKIAVNEVGKIITKEAKELGATIKIIQNETTGDHIVATFNHHVRKTKKDEKKGFLILCHMDTVYPIGTIDRMPFHMKDNRILGPGVADMKSGAVIGLYAIKSLIEEGQMPNVPITFLFTSDEETGSRTSRKLIEELAFKSRLVLVLEPGMPDGSIKTWRKGVGSFHIEVHGQAAHSGGNHDKGRNAIEELAHQVIRVQGLTNYSHGTTLNVGICKGGTVVNVVPDLAWMDVDLRVLDPGESDRIIEEIKHLKPILQGTTLEITGGLNRPPMPYDDLMDSTFRKAKRIAAGINVPITASGTGGASDGNFIAPLGIPVLDGLGAIGGDYHSKNEYIEKQSLLSRTQLLSAILQNW